MQQLNVWVPLRGPVTVMPLAVCDGATFAGGRRGLANGLFGRRVNVFYGGE